MDHKQSLKWWGCVFSPNLSIVFRKVRVFL
jgi:hypothetical protein